MFQQATQRTGEIARCRYVDRCNLEDAETTFAKAFAGPPTIPNGKYFAEHLAIPGAAISTRRLGITANVTPKAAPGIRTDGESWHG